MELLNLTIALLAILVSLIYLYVKRSFSYWKRIGVPHEKPSFPHGNYKISAKTENYVTFTTNYYTKFKDTSKVCGMYLFTRPMMLLLDLELIKNIWVKDFSSFSDRSFYYNDKDDPLSAHLVALDGKKWRNVRTKLTPTFTSGKMKFMFPTIATVGGRLTECLSEWIQECDEFEIKSVLARFSMDVIGTCAFGIECNTLKDIDNDFYRMGRRAMDKPKYNQRQSVLLNDVKHFARFIGIKSMREDVTAFFLDIVKSTIEHRETNNIHRNDFMDLLIKLKTEDNESDATKGLTVNQIAAQAFLFFIAGYDSSSTTLLFSLYELALNKHVQTKLRQDIQNALEKHGEFTYEMMMDISYLDQTINETLRKYPVFSTLRRVAETNYRIPDTDIVIEKGVIVVVPVFAIHNDPQYYPEPEKFDPNRFAPGETQKRHPMSWLAFGDGPRNCIARRFGMMQIRIGLITLLSNFKFEPCAKTPMKMEFGPSPIAISPKEKIYLKIKPIEKD